MMRTPLHFAVLAQQTEIVSDLITSKDAVILNATDSNDKTALDYAFQSRNLKIIIMLLDAGAKTFNYSLRRSIESINFNILTRKKYLLHEAIKIQNLNVIKLIFETGVNVETVNECGNKPIHVAIDSKNLDILELLIDLKADVNAKNKIGFTPLHWAIESIKLKNDEVDECTGIVKLLLEAGADANTKCASGNSPMIAAIKFQNENIIKLLLDAGADVKVDDENGDSPLHLAVKRKNRNKNIVQLLIDYKAAIDAQNSKLYTPLHLALRFSKFDALKALLEAGADVNLENCIGYTVLHTAIISKKLHLVSLLLKYGADFNLLTKSKSTPFMLFVMNSIVQKNTTEDFNLFLEHSDVNFVYETGKNFLSFILKSNRYARNRHFFYKYILEHVAKVKVLNQQVDSSLLETISRKSDYSDYFNECIKELENAKSTKIHNCHISFLNLLVDNKFKFIKYAGNQDLVKDSKNSVKKFPIYGPTMESNMSYGIESRRIFDEAADFSSFHLQILNPTHLIIRNTLDALNLEDWKKLCEKNRAQE